MLSTYSSETLALLLKAFPEFSELVVEQDEVFQIETTTPAGWDFWLSSEEEERLTVGFAEYHCHFGGYQGDTPEADATQAVSFIKALRSEELVLAVWYKGEEYTGSDIIERNEKPQQVVSGQNQTVKMKKWS